MAFSLGVPPGGGLLGKVFVFATLVAQAREAELPFLVIGGNAVIAYGYPRHTKDFDVLVDDRHRFRWHQLFLQIGYTLKHAHPVFQMYVSGLEAHPPIDLMLVEHGTFAKFQERAGEATVEGVAVPIPSLLHLLALKLHAERSGGERRVGRDLNDVLHLMHLHGIKLESPEFEEILNRYGNDAIRLHLSVMLAGAARSGLPGLRPPGGPAG